MNEHKLAEPEDTVYFVQESYPRVKKVFVPIEIKLPKSPSLREKIKMCIDILFDRTYKR